MASSSALAGSVVIHGALAAALFLLLARPQPDRRGGTRAAGVAIEVVNATPLPTEIAGGSPRPAAPATSVRTPRQARTVATRTQGTPTWAAETTVRMEDPSASGGAASPSPGGPGDGGRGGGRGAGIGLGDGDGTANASDVAGLPLPMPPPIKRSLARPPRLIWPTRDGPVVESELYVARLTVDVDGLVDAVRLVRRFREARDDQAEDAVWKFRYSPALDDDGHPIPATIEQPFLLRLR